MIKGCSTVWEYFKQKDCFALDRSWLNGRPQNDIPDLSSFIKTCSWYLKNLKDVGHFPLTKCLCPQYVHRLPGMSPGPHLQTEDGFQSP